MVKKIIQNDTFFRNAFLLGDTVNDGLAANENNLKFIKASYGYGKKQDWSNVKVLNQIDHIFEIMEYIQ